MRTAYTEAQLRGAKLVWLVTLEFAGRSWCFSSTPLELDDGEGGTVQYQGGIDDLEFEDGAELFSDAPSPRSVSLDLLWPESFAALVNQGHDPGQIRGEVALVRVGDAYADRLVVLVGYASDPEYGAAGEPVALTLEDDSTEDTAQIPEPSATVTEGDTDSATWDSPAAGAEGLAYPIVFGQPGPYLKIDGTTGTTSGSPGLFVITDIGSPYPYTVLIAGHETVTGETGGSVALYNTRLSESQTMTAELMRDGLGRLVTVVDIDSLAGRILDPWEEDDEIWTDWIDGPTLYRLDAREPVLTAGDLLVWMFERVSAPVDRGRLRAAKVYLDRFRVAGYIDERVSPSEWVKDHLLPILPVSLCSGPAGQYPLVWRWDATERDAVAHLTVGPGCVRRGAVVFEGREDVVNEITLSYAPRAHAGTFKRSRTMTGNPDLIGSPDTITCLHARTSRARYGERAETVECEISYDLPTADLILTWMALARGFVRRVVTVDLDQDYGWLQKGDVVTLTDADSAFSRRVGLVRRMKWTLSDLSVEMVFFEDPARDSRQ